MKKHLIVFTAFMIIVFNLRSQSFNNILFTGRFNFSDPAKVEFSNCSSSIKANFTGTGISVSLASTSNGASVTSYLSVIVDGNIFPETRNLIKVSKATKTTFVLASGLVPGNHTIELVKETEYNTKVAFYGFTVTGGSLGSKPIAPSLSIEFYGDSNPAGWDAYDPRDAGAVINSGGYYTYPGITARMLNAQYHNISMSGVGITDRAWRNLINYYHLIHMNDAATGNNLWNFSNFNANAVVINASSNDYYSSATKSQIKAGWKSFVAALRGRYPTAHIVLAESYGWALNEPTTYIAETVAEINAAGDANVSFVLFPWLWGQNHAVINEHAGFANILAKHLAIKLSLPDPTPSDLSSFGPYGAVTNGSFEKSTIAGVADGWRPNGNVQLIKNVSDAKDGTNYLKLYNTAWVNYATEAKPGDIFTVTGWMKGAQNGDLGKLKIEFKDEGQNTISTNEGLHTLTTGWQNFTTIATVPPNTWSVWIVLVAERRDYVSFDKVSMSVIQGAAVSASKQVALPIVDTKISNSFIVYPNPNKGNEVRIAGMSNEPSSISIYDVSGKLIQTMAINENEKVILFNRKLRPGIYNLVRTTTSSKISKQFIVD